MSPMNHQPNNNLTKITTLLKTVHQNTILKQNKLKTKLHNKLTPTPTPKLITTNKLTKFQAQLKKLKIKNKIKFKIKKLIYNFLKIQTDSDNTITAATVFNNATNNTINKLHKLITISHNLINNTTLTQKIKKSFTS